MRFGWLTLSLSSPHEDKQNIDNVLIQAQKLSGWVLRMFGSRNIISPGRVCTMTSPICGSSRHEN